MYVYFIRTQLKPRKTYVVHRREVIAQTVFLYKFRGRYPSLGGSFWPLGSGGTQVLKINAHTSEQDLLEAWYDHLDTMVSFAEAELARATAEKKVPLIPFDTKEFQTPEGTCLLCDCTAEEICGKDDCHHCRAWVSGRDVGWLEDHEAGDDQDFLCANGECPPHDENLNCNGVGRCLRRTED